jgi:hypothetical protein
MNLCRSHNENRVVYYRVLDKIDLMHTETFSQHEYKIEVVPVQVLDHIFSLEVLPDVKYSKALKVGRLWTFW